MKCTVKLLDNDTQPWFLGARDLPADYILNLATERLPVFKEEGAAFAQNSLPFFGKELVNVVKAGGDEKAIDKALIELALATVTLELFFGVEEKELRSRNLMLTVYEQDGAVRYDRVDEILN